jgi:hypothetical protein
VNIETLIREANPVRSELVPGPRSDEARATLLLIVASPTLRHKNSLRLRGVTLLTLGLAAAVALLVALLIPGSPIPASPAAAATLRHLAAIAVDQPAANPPGIGQYEYTQSEEAYSNCNLDGPRSYCYFLPESRQIWIGWDGSGRVLETFGSPSFLSPTDRSNWENVGSPTLAIPPSDTTFGPNTLSVGPAGLSLLSTDPRTLAAQLLAGKLEGVPQGAGEEFIQIGDLLRETDASPALRSAAFQVAATIPGVVLLGQVSDHAGRIGIGLASTFKGVRNELIFDPSTTALIGEQGFAEGTAGPDGLVPLGTVMNWSVYLSAGVVSSLSSTPSGSVSPAPPTCVVSAAPPPASTLVPTLSGPGVDKYSCDNG